MKRIIVSSKIRKRFCGHLRKTKVSKNVEILVWLNSLLLFHRLAKAADTEAKLLKSKLINRSYIQAVRKVSDVGF
ncbi:unnamed protein product [Clavelina lepadiformis]|uniref:Ribosomal protein L20 n=1 Tax=Clavelina lepadiformis TaxID=159417 RepID=A0ABP0FV95_CLALP